MGLNGGGFLAAIGCSYVSHYYGWHAGFGLAAIGMIFGMILFAIKGPQMEEKVKRPIGKAAIFIIFISLLAAFLLKEASVAQYLFLPLAITGFITIFLRLRKDISREAMNLLGTLLVLLIAYFMVEELMGSYLIVYAENSINLTLFKWTIPPSVLIAINPLVIITAGPLLARMKTPIFKRLQISFLLLSLAFAVLYGATYFPEPSVIYLFIAFSFIALGEIFLAPAIFSFCSEVAPKERMGLSMGLVTFSFSLASLLSGQIGQLPVAPSNLFLTLSAGALTITLISLIFKRKKATAEFT
jgi:POT family proton-dependent oligopeptide transporter